MCVWMHVRERVCVGGGGDGSHKAPSNSQPFSQLLRRSKTNMFRMRGARSIRSQRGERHTVHAWSCTGVMKESRPFATFTAT
jgi:hypothetical protein